MMARVKRYIGVGLYGIFMILSLMVVAWFVSDGCDYSNVPLLLSCMFPVVALYCGSTAFLSRKRRFKAWVILPFAIIGNMAIALAPFVLVESSGNSEYVCIALFESMSEVLKSFSVWVCVCAVALGLLSLLFLFKRNDDSPQYRALLRKAILVELAAFSIAAIIVLGRGIYFFVSGASALYIVTILLNYIVNMLLLAWLLSKVVSATNKHFFELVNVSTKATAKPTAVLEKLVASESDEVLRASFYLLMLVNPAARTLRINESISPRTGFFHIETEYEVSIPKDLQGSDIVVPASFQDKRELTNDLKMLDSDGKRLERLKDRETREYTELAFAIVGEALTGCTREEALSFSKEVMTIVFGSNYRACPGGRGS